MANSSRSIPPNRNLRDNAGHFQCPADSDCATAVSPSPSPDQAAIADYFRSPQFAETKVRRLSEDDRKIRSAARSRHAGFVRSWTMELSDERGLSIGVAFYGLAVCWMLMSMGIPYGVWILSGFDGQLFPIWVIFIQLTFAAPLACLTLISVTSALWCVSLLRRFLLAVAVLMPGTAMLAFGLAQLGWLDLAEAFAQTLYQILAYTVVSSSLVLPIQMWGRWSLSHARESPGVLPKLGTRSIMELTMIASLVFAIFMFVRGSELWYQILIVAAIALVSTIAITLIVVSHLLRPRTGRWLAILVSSGFAYAAMTLTSICVFASYDESIVWFNQNAQYTVIVIISILGTCLFMATAMVGQWWLRGCGWQCISPHRAQHSGALEVDFAFPVSDTDPIQRTVAS
ncbi:hypothetical protein K227x_36490 [Rubripirellula lacrimiformis]|uniref:Uncharacterized protein n=1 Tax=Rubripirellula lacrimiformis TaxID=1930273 RepID=A0A517NDP6_9BACT|nr:hypothetical protein [Rubripirellula lacrimiformis]QDT05249.1 hypothetical protein K227x_36490 [Rubripirellula lacrimiformis]